MKRRLISLVIQNLIATGAYAEPEPELPDGVWEASPGVFKATCRSCERSYELFSDLCDFDPDYSYCGGSERCVP